MSGVELGHSPSGIGPVWPKSGVVGGRIVEIVVSILVLLFLSPSLLLVALASALTDPGPLLSVEPRIGRGGRVFRCYRFRTVSTRMDGRLTALLAVSPNARAEFAQTGRLRHDPRLTTLGGFLRISGLDESPQFLNVILGDMSLVGPAPITADAAALFGRRFKDYAAVRPGITGLQQIRRHEDISFRRRMAMDVLYARRKSVAFDLSIVLAAIPAMFFRQTV